MKDSLRFAQEPYNKQIYWKRDLMHLYPNNHAQEWLQRGMLACKG